MMQAYEKELAEEKCPVCGELLSRHISTEKDPETLLIALRCMRLKFGKDK